MFKLLQKLNLGAMFRYLLALILIIDGTDKFFNFVTYWPDYLAPQFSQITGLSNETILAVIGVTEFLVGAILWLNAKWGGLLAAGLLFGIAINLIIAGRFFNIVLIDVALAVACLALAQAELPDATSSPQTDAPPRAS